MRKVSLRGLHAILLCVSVGTAWELAHAHGDQHHSQAKAVTAAPTDQDKSFGKPGSLKQPARTIRVEMHDTMRFTPSDIIVQQGETVRFVVSNRGKLMHEMVIGTMEDLKQHHAMMQKHPGMAHDEPYMAHVASGKEEILVWQFTRAGEFHFACLVPGHFEAGMLGSIKVLKG